MRKWGLVDVELRLCLALGLGRSLGASLGHVGHGGGVQDRRHLGRHDLAFVSLEELRVVLEVLLPTPELEARVDARHDQALGKHRLELRAFGFELSHEPALAVLADQVVGVRERHDHVAPAIVEDADETEHGQARLILPLQAAQPPPDVVPALLGRHLASLGLLPEVGLEGLEPGHEGLDPASRHAQPLLGRDDLGPGHHAELPLTEPAVGVRVDQVESIVVLGPVLDGRLGLGLGLRVLLDGLPQGQRLDAPALALAKLDSHGRQRLTGAEDVVLPVLHVEAPDLRQLQLLVFLGLALHDEDGLDSVDEGEALGTLFRHFLTDVLDELLYGRDERDSHGILLSLVWWN